MQKDHKAMNQTQRAYNGVDNLDVMTAARNYNRAIMSYIERYCGTAKTVLDFGAGIGTFSRMLREAGKKVACLEPDEKMAQKLEKQFKVYRSLDEFNETFDLVVSLNVFEHIEADGDVLKSLVEKLRPGGKAFIYVPAFEMLYSSMDKKVGHVRRYNMASLKALLQKAGLEIEFIRYADSLGFLASLVFKYFGNSSGELSVGSIRIYDKYVFPISNAVDKVTFKLFGKNITVVARKPK